MKNIKLFGFSAGAQTVHRYSLHQNYDIKASITVKYIISDPDIFPYFNRERPSIKGDSFGVPEAYWIPEAWKVSSFHFHQLIDATELISFRCINCLSLKYVYGTKNSQPWISKFEECASYDNWRDGLKEITGYISRLSHRDLARAVEGNLIFISFLDASFYCSLLNFLLNQSIPKRMWFT